jgi:hypothetical protein
MYRTVDMAFRRKMDDRLGFVLLKDVANEIAIDDVTAHELVKRIHSNLLKVFYIAGTRELIDNSHGRLLRDDAL